MKKNLFRLWGVLNKECTLVNVYDDYAAAKEHATAIKGTIVDGSFSPIAKPVGKKKVKLPAYPGVVCDPCATAARKAAGWGAGDIFRESTWHRAVCHVCNHVAYVTEPRDYGYPPFKGFAE